MRCVLGIDAGGSKSDVLLVRDDGMVLGHGYVDYSDPASGRSKLGSGRSVASVSKAVRQAVGQRTFDELYLSSVTTLDPYAVVPDNCAKTIENEYVYEADPAFALVGATAGIVVVAGTGAMVHVRTHDGRGGRYDGLGPLMGDFGSGFYIGMLTLRAVARSVIHPRHATALTEAVTAHFGFTEAKWPVYQLVQYMIEPRDRAEIAGIARVTDETAEAGDPVAIAILHEAAAAMAETITDAVDVLGIAEEEYPLVASGSIATHSRIYWEHLSAILRERAPHLHPVKPELPPVVGVALITLRKLAAADPDTLQQNLFHSYREVLGLQN